MAHAQAVEVARLGERVGHRLVEAARAHDGVHRVHDVLHLRARAHAAGAAGQRGRDAVHAPQAQHLLVQVDLALEVRAERGRAHGQHARIARRIVGHRAAQAAQDVLDVGARDVRSHHGAEARHAEAQVGRRRGRRPLVHDASAVAGGGAHRAPGHLHHERGGRGRALFDAVVIHAALVAHGALAEQAQVAARAARAARFERGGLQQDVHRPVRDLGIQAAHDACERHGAELRRGDDRHVGRERAILAVERGQALAFGGRAHHDVRHAVRVLELVQVEGVQRLAEQEQDVVRHVHDVVDGALADSGQALDHPVGARAHLDPADDTRGVARAARRVLDGDLHRLVDGRR